MFAIVRLRSAFSSQAVASEDTKIALLLTSAREFCFVPIFAWGNKECASAVKFFLAKCCVGDKQRQMAAMQGAALVQESPCLQQTDDGEQKPAQQSVEPTAAAGTVK